MGMPLKVGADPPKQGLIVAVKGTLNDRIEIGVTAAQEDVAPDAAFDRGLDSQRAKASVFTARP